jgi:branched-chain amino acid transport system substrate-binding protein
MTMRKRWNFGLGIALLLAALAPATVGNAQTKKPIKIGLLTSLSGPFTPWGILVRDGMKLAISEVNAAGGVAGQPIELVERDTRNKPSEAITAFKYMVEREGVVAPVCQRRR